jgi:hypothetical protein
LKTQFGAYRVGPLEAQKGFFCREVFRGDTLWAVAVGPTVEDCDIRAGGIAFALEVVGDSAERLFRERPELAAAAEAAFKASRRN